MIFLFEVAPAISKEEKIRRKKIQEVKNSYASSRNYQMQEPPPF